VKNAKAFWACTILFTAIAWIAAKYFLIPLGIPPKVHAWILGVGAITTAISEGYFKSLVSELEALLRRGSYSTSQFEELMQWMPRRINSVSRLWALTMAMKMIVGLCAAALQWDQLTPQWTILCILTGYCLLVGSVVMAAQSHRWFRYTQDVVRRVQQKEIEVRERNRLIKELKSGQPHDFKSDNALANYSKPARPI
jgi:hypothetical protein